MQNKNSENAMLYMIFLVDIKRGNNIRLKYRY